MPRYSHLYGGIDAFNALEQASKMHLSLAQARAPVPGTGINGSCHGWLGYPVTRLRRVDGLARRIRQDTWQHYREHTLHVVEWRQQKGLWREGEALKAIPIILGGSRLPRYSHLYGGIDEFNALEQASKMHLSLAQVRADVRDAHQRLLSCLAGLPSDALASGGRLARRIRQDTWQHYREHTLHVVEWRQQKGLWRESALHSRLNAHKGR